MGIDISIAFVVDLDISQFEKGRDRCLRSVALQVGNIVNWQGVGIMNDQFS